MVYSKKFLVPRFHRMSVTEDGRLVDVLNIISPKLLQKEGIAGVSNHREHGANPEL